MSDQTLYLWWESRDPSQADDARRLARFVNRLPDFDPIYRSWLESPETKEETVSIPLSEAAAKQLLVDNIAHYDAPSRDAPPDPWPELGSTIWGGHAGPRLMISARRATPTPPTMSAPSVGAAPSVRTTSSCGFPSCVRPPEERGAPRS